MSIVSELRIASSPSHFLPKTQTTLTVEWRPRRNHDFVDENVRESGTQMFSAPKCDFVNEIVPARRPKFCKNIGESFRCRKRRAGTMPAARTRRENGSEKECACFYRRAWSLALFFAERSDVKNRLSKGEDEDLRQRASSSFYAFSPKMIHHCHSGIMQGEIT